MFIGYESRYIYEVIRYINLKEYGIRGILIIIILILLIEIREDIWVFYYVIVII